MAFIVCQPADVPVEQWRVLSRDSLFSSPDFVSVWEAWGARPIFFLEDDNGQVQAGMAGIVTGWWPVRRFESMTDGLYGGPFYAEAADESVSRSFERHVINYLKSHSIIRADIHHPVRAPHDHLMRRSSIPTHVVSVADEYHGPDHPKIREHLRSAHRGGGTVGVFADVGRLDEFYHLVERTERRHGLSPRYPREVFVRLMYLTHKDPRIIWLEVQYEGRMIASRISFIEREQVLNWQSFSDKRYSRIRANYLMLDHVLSIAQKRNITEVNLGWSPPDADTLIDFKRRWGGQATEYSSYTWLSRTGKLLYALRSS